MVCVTERKRWVKYLARRNALSPPGAASSDHHGSFWASDVEVKDLCRTAGFIFPFFPFLVFDLKSSFRLSLSEKKKGRDVDFFAHMAMPNEEIIFISWAAVRLLVMNRLIKCTVVINWAMECKRLPSFHRLFPRFSLSFSYAK